MRSIARLADKLTERLAPKATASACKMLPCATPGYYKCCSSCPCFGF